MATASVIISARNARATLPRTLRALRAQDFEEHFEIIVVDDGSDDDTAEIAEREGEPVRVLRQSQAGMAAARNLGVSAAKGDALAFTDADCFPRPEWLREGVAALERADLVQGAVTADPEVSRGPFDRTVFVEAERGFYETASLFVRRALFERIGGFEDWLEARGKQLAEDMWLGWRARRAGARTAFCERALVEHAVFPRGPAAYVAERARLYYFPAIARKMPELREQGLFFHRYWLTPKTAAFDAGIVGFMLAARLRSPVPLLVALPYARIVARQSRRWGRRRAPLVAVVELAADAVGAVGLAAGSLRSRSPLL